MANTVKNPKKKVYRYPKLTLHDNNSELSQLIQEINALLPQSESQCSIVKAALYEKLSKLKQLKPKK